MTKFYNHKDWEPVMMDDEGMEAEERKYWQQHQEDEAADELEQDPFLSDAEADADALASAGWGTDEDYGSFGGDDW